MASTTQHPEPVCGLMPVRNAMPYLRQTLASIAAQDYPDFRLIAWDNGSTDGSADELRAWIGERIPGYVITGRPLPLGRCRATLIDMAECEWCAWFDADDLYRPDRISTQMHAAAQDPGLALIGGAMRVIDEQGQPTGDVRREPMADRELRWALRFCNPIAQPAAMLRRSAVLDAGNYPDVPGGKEDYEMWVRLSAKHTMHNLGAVVVDYRVHAHNVTKRFDNDPAGHQHELRAKLHNELFPGLGQAAMFRLFEVLCPHRLIAVERDDLALLDRAVQSVAEATGLPAAALRRAALFRQQRNNLRTRWLKARPVVRPVWPLLRGAVRLASGKTDAPVSPSNDATAA